VRQIPVRGTELARPNTAVINAHAVQAVVLTSEVRKDSVFKNYAGGINNNFKMLNPNLIKKGGVYNALDDLKYAIQSVIIKNAAQHGIGNDGLKAMIAFARERGGFSTNASGEDITTTAPEPWRKASAAMQKDFAAIGLYTGAEGDKMLSSREASRGKVRGWRAAHALDFMGDELIEKMDRLPPAAGAAGQSPLDILAKGRDATETVSRISIEISSTPYPAYPGERRGR
jgi:hypothetical protein